MARLGMLLVASDNGEQWLYDPMSWRYDPTGEGTEYEQPVPLWAMTPCPDCHFMWRVEGHGQGCPR